ncbi:MAG: hypothetical protein DRJ40_02545 [Thermoprotei archaeon]|nr:MAG: hypothetical protein DRJ40_02545 [Thermoprotei archaeon]
MIREEALDWLEGALVDLNEAKEAFKRGSYHLAVFLSHQAVEKALKAYIIGFKRVRPPRSHDLLELLHVAGLELEVSDVELLTELSPYYVIARYPNAGLRKPWREIAEGTARRFLSIAEKVVHLVKQMFNHSS